MPCKCNRGLRWEATTYGRTTCKNKCPYCTSIKVWADFNDLATHFPEIAKEADGWDPCEFMPISNKRMPWICSEGHCWTTVIKDKTLGGNGCPYCAEYGFNPDKPAWFYLLQRKGEQQLGITNDFPRRMREHSLKGWEEVDKSGPHAGKEVLCVENAFKNWLREIIGLVKDKKENWYTSKMEVHSLAELKEKSGIETSIF